MIFLSLPLPPPANATHRIRPGAKKPYPSPRYKAWIREASWIAKNSGVEKVCGRYRADIFVPEKMRGDADNRIKPTLDLLKNIGLTDDDKHNRNAHVWRNRSIPSGTCTVVIRRASEADFSPLDLMKESTECFHSTI